MKKLLFSILLTATGFLAQAAATGSCESKADSLKIGGSKPVTLVNEYDPDDGEYWDGGAYYLEVTLTRGKSYTLWIEGGDVGDISVDAYPRDTTEKEDERDIWGPIAGFDDEQVQGDKDVFWLYAEDWDSEDPSSWKYYICLSGDIGMRTSVSLVEGIKSFLPEGSEGNPVKFTIPDRPSKYAAQKKITEDGVFHFQASLTAGRKYFVRTTGGTEAAPNFLTVKSETDFTAVDDPAGDKSNPAQIVYPAASGTFDFEVAGNAGAAFGFEAQAVPMRPIGDHPSTAIENGGSARFVPGRMVAGDYYYDSIIDEWLYRVASVQKGERWVFDAKGADRAIEMRIYDAKGSVIASNASVGNGSYDVRCAFEASAAGTYYVGVFNPSLDMSDVPVGAQVTMTARTVKAADGVTVALSPLPAKEGDDPVLAASASGPYELTASCWSQTFSIAARKGITYTLATTFAGDLTTDLHLRAELYTVSGSTERTVAMDEDIVSPGSSISFDAAANAQYRVRISVVEGPGLDYPPFNVHAMAYTTGGDGLGILQVVTKGVDDAVWMIDDETTAKYYGSGFLLLAGTHTVKFASVKGFNVTTDPSSGTVTIVPGTDPTVVTGTYNDKFDSMDDTYSGATKLTVSAKPVSSVRTLWHTDKADWFAFSAKDGVYHNFTLDGANLGDAVLSVLDAQRDPVGLSATLTTDVVKLPLKKGSYYLKVEHGTVDEVDGAYTLTASSANVGAIKFAKKAVSIKKNAGVVKLTVNRTAKEGRVRVRYGTVAGTAKPGERYIAQSGILEWPDGDSKAKTIEIKLIPDLVAVYDAAHPTTEFTVQLKPMDEVEIVDDDEYPAQITDDTCTVTITESASKSADSIEKAYAKTVAKVAKVKTEDVALRSGTFYGVLTEDGSALTNGLPQLASVTLTTKVSAGKDDTLSAKVALAGKTYTFKTDTKNPAKWENLDDGRMQITLKLVQKVDKASYTNELTLTVRDGQTTDAEGWLGAGGTAELVMNVPDANNKGVQEEIRYVGDIYRQNAKIQNYLNVVTNFFGYYTVALAPEGVSSMDGIPAGNGYLTVKVDNKGTAKVAGILADNTKVSVSVTAAAIREDKTSAIGYSMYLPVFVAKSPYCFGGTLRLYAKEGKTLPNKDYEIVIDSTTALVWNNDNAKLTYYNEDGWRILCDPVGGWYDTVMNLQAYYLNYAFEVGGADITEFPTELVANGYQVITDVQPNGEPVGLVNDAFSTAKKSLVKDGKLYDLVNSVNPCNVQVKLARATGIVTGSFSIWSEDEDGLKQKEITGFKHNGVLLLSRDEFSPISEDVLSVGFSLKTGVKVTDENPDTGKKTTRSWNLSLPFNLLGVDQGDVDWWADDWGWNPDWGEEPAE